MPRLDRVAARRQALELERAVLAVQIRSVARARFKRPSMAGKIGFSRTYWRSVRPNSSIVSESYASR
jgi:hypothetical protein